MNKQLQSLLKESRHHFYQRNLKKALNTAKIALEFGINEKAEDITILEANLLLSRIYLINGRYKNDQSDWKKAAQYIDEATRLNQKLKSEKASIDISYACGKVNLNLQNFAKAKYCLSECLNTAESINDINGMGLARLTFCEMYIAQGELDRAVEEGESALNFIQENTSSAHLRLYAKAYLQLSQAYIKRKDYSQSLEMSQQLLRTSRACNDVELEVIALRNIAVVCGVKSNYKIGMQYFLEALTKCEAIGYRELLLQLHVNIGTIYAHLYNYPEAIKRYQKVLDEFGEVLDEKTQMVIFNNLGNIYLTTEHPEQAIHHFENAFALAKENENPSMTAHTLSQISRTKLQLEQYDEAVQAAQHAEDIFGRIGQVNGIQLNLLNLSEIAFRKGNYEVSIGLAEQSIKMAESLKDDACEIRAYRQLAKTNKALGDFEKALIYQERYSEMQNNFTRLQQSRQFLDMEIRHAIREKEKEINLLTRDNQYKELLLQKSDKIARQNEELRMANEDLKQFAYVASHDLKEPLRMIGAYSQLIHRKVENHLDRDATEYFDYIQGGVTRMNELLDGLLKYSTIGKAKNSFEEVDLNKSLLVSIANLRSRIEETNAIIEDGKLPVVRAHHDLMVQLFQNLIGNALKFKKHGEKPKIQVSAFETADENTIYIKDNGIGISPEYREKIFDIFHRLHPREQFEGTGIGLAICQKIAKRMNARLWVESREGEGATFFLAVPK